MADMGFKTMAVTGHSMGVSLVTLEKKYMHFHHSYNAVRFYK
jgi:hypothetical protein